MHLNRSQQGFTIIVAIVLGAGGMALSSSMKGQSRAKVDSRGRAVVTAALRKMQADTTWMTTCDASLGLRPGICTVPTATVIKSTDRLLAEPDGTVTHTLRITATAVDLAADGTGAADADSRQIDVYRLHVEDTVRGPMLPAAGTIQRGDASINPSVRGRTGVVRVRMCAIDAQVDERMGTGLCSAASGGGAAAARTLPIDPPLAGSCVGAAVQLICNPWTAAEAADNSLAERYTDASIRPMAGASVTINGPLAGTSITRTVTMGAQGSMDVTGLEPGQYRIVTPAVVSWNGRRWVTWSSHSVPSSGYLIVDKGTMREATLLMRPERPTIRVRLETVNRTNPLINPVIEPRARFNQTVRLMPVPSDRASLERGSAQNGWTQISPGDSSVLLRDSSPGLYSMHLLHYPRGDVSKLVGADSFAWIDPSGTTRPATLVVRQDFCDETVRHNTYVVPICGQLRWCWQGTRFIGNCNDNPVVTGGATTGAGGA
jgi:hypothetical protein